MSLPKICKSKSFLAGMGGSNVIILTIIITFFYPGMTANAADIDELEINQTQFQGILGIGDEEPGTLKTNVEKLIILECIDHPNHTLCN